MAADQIMIDIETLDNKTSAVVLSIGAVRFDLRAPPGEFHSSFYGISIDPEDQLAKGRTLSLDTVRWWMQQDDAARREVFDLSLERNGGVKFSTSYLLRRLTAFFQQGPVNGVWGCGPDFDNMIVGSLYETYNEQRPWSYGANRCFRTIKKLPFPSSVPIPKRRGTHHQALDDAATQAEYLQAFYKGFPV